MKQSAEKIREQRQRELERPYRPMPSPFEAKVVGVSFTDGYPQNLYDLDWAWQSWEHHEEPMSVILVRNPDNAYDSNAIQVHVPALGESGMIGHLAAPIAARLAPEMDAGGEWVATVNDVLIHPDHMENPGISIRCQRKEKE